MHVLTKAFVVLAAILSVALSALVIAYAVNTDRIQADYRARVAQVDQVNAQIATQASQANSEQARLNAQIEQLMRDAAPTAGRPRDRARRPPAGPRPAARLHAPAAHRSPR